MSPNYKLRKDWQPDEADRLVLQAVLLPGEAGHQAFLAWAARVTLDDVSAAAYRLLPQLYQRLVNRGAQGPDLARLKGVARKTWYENQIGQASLVELMNVLQSSGVEPLLLGGAITIALSGAAAAGRNTSDLACAIPIEQMPMAADSLDRAGWQPASASGGFKPQRHWRYVSGVAYQPTTGGQPIRLRWRLVLAGPSSQADASIWRRSLPVQLPGAAGRIPDPTDQLLLACLDGAAWRSEPDWRWVCDATRLISEGSVDWDRLLDSCADNGGLLALVAALGFLASTLKAPVPDQVLGRLRATPISQEQLHSFRLASERPGFAGLVLRRWHEYRKLTGSQPEGVWGFVSYLEAAWGLASAWDVPLHAAKRLAARVSRDGHAEPP